MSLILDRHRPMLGDRNSRFLWVLCAVSTSARVVRGDDQAVEVQVHGGRNEGPTKEPSVAGSIIRQDRLRAPGLKATDVLRTQPGMAVLETGGFGSWSTASMRGATAAQMPVYLAGIRLNDDVGGVADLSTVPLWLLHRVEIYRSHTPLEGDQLGIGGAVFFEPRRPRGPEGSAGTMGGSYGTRSLWAHVGAGDADASALAGLRFEAAKNNYGFVHDGGTRFDPHDDRHITMTNAEAQMVDLWAMGSVRLGEHGRVDLLFSDVEKERGVPANVLYPSRRARMRYARRMAGITTNVPCAESGCTLTATTAAIATRTRFEDPLHELSLGGEALELSATRIENSLAALYTWSESVSIAPTVRASTERLAIAQEPGLPLDARRTSSRLAVQVAWTIGGGVRARAMTSAQCDGTSVTGTPPWTAWGSSLGTAAEGSAICGRVHPAARAGIEWGAGGIRIVANGGRYVRMPTLGELYGTSGAIRGNMALEPEAGISGEVGVRWAGSRSSALAGASIDLFAFARWADDLIAYRRTAAYAFPYNVGTARVVGAEAQASYRVSPLAQVGLSATIQDPRDTSRTDTRNDLLPHVPRLILAPRIELAPRIQSSFADTARMSVAYLYQSSYYADLAGLVTIPSQGSLDIDGELGVLSGHLAIRARMSNALNQTRLDLIGYPLPGRSVYIAMESKW